MGTNFLNSLGKWFSDGNNLQNFGMALSGAGNIYGAYNQQKMAKKLYNMQVADYNRQKKRQEEAERNFNAGFGGGLVDL